MRNVDHLSIPAPILILAQDSSISSWAALLSISFAKLLVPCCTTPRAFDAGVYLTTSICRGWLAFDARQPRSGLRKSDYGAALTIEAVVKKSRPTAPMLMYQHSFSGVCRLGR